MRAKTQAFTSRVGTGIEKQTAQQVAGLVSKDPRRARDVEASTARPRKRAAVPAASAMGRPTSATSPVGKAYYAAGPVEPSISASARITSPAARDAPGASPDATVPSAGVAPRYHEVASPHHREAL